MRTVEVVAAREMGRKKRGYSDLADIAAFDEVLRTQTPRLGLWLDTSGMTVEETVERILEGLEEARVDFRAANRLSFVRSGETSIRPCSAASRCAPALVGNVSSVQVRPAR